MAMSLEVIGSDGERAGEVKEVRDADFLLDRSMARDVFVPFDAVATVDSGVVLKVTADEVGARGWPQSTLV